MTTRTVLEHRLTLTTPLPPAGTLWPKTLADKLRTMALHDHALLDAIETFVDWKLSVMTGPGSGRRLIDRLRAFHACSKHAAPDFTQLPQRPSGLKQWQCEACHIIVAPGDRDEKGGA